MISVHVDQHVYYFTHLAQYIPAGDVYRRLGVRVTLQVLVHDVIDFIDLQRILTNQLRSEFAMAARRPLAYDASRNGMGHT